MERKSDCKGKWKMERDFEIRMAKRQGDTTIEETAKEWTIACRKRIEEPICETEKKPKLYNSTKPLTWLSLHNFMKI